MRKARHSSPLESLAPRHKTQLSNLGQAQEPEKNATATGQHYAKDCQNTDATSKTCFLTPPLPHPNYCVSDS